MKKILMFALVTGIVSQLSAQSKTKGLPVPNQPGDHIMLQLGTDQWSGAPDSITSHKKGLSRGFNAYVMMSKPFKGNPRMSLAFGLGVSTSNIYFSKYNIDIKSTAAKLPFTDLASANRFKKYKIATAYLEVPVELRFTADPANEAKSVKGALGVKVAQLLNVHTKGKTLEDASGKTINTYTQKETSKRYFNTTRLSVTGRVGYGHYSLFGSYAINPLLKDGTGPDIKPFQIGICISGL